MNDFTPPDEQLRVWALDTAVQSRKKGTSPKTIINDAREYYGFMKGSECEIRSIDEKIT